MPAWDFDVAVGADYIDSEQMGIGSNTFESRTTNWYASMQARKDRWTLGGTINRQSIVGKGVNGTGLTQRTTGLTLMPGYQILTQAENGVNLDVDAILDMSYTTFTHNPSAWYVRPGAKVAVNRLTKAGLFQVAGIYTHLRNISGDSDQFTTNSGINSYGAAFDYICLFTKEIYGNIGLSYLTLDDMPSGANTGMDDELTDVNVRAGGAITERLSIDGGYFQAIDGRDTQGFSLRGAWTF
jgi:hypothetical protein